MSVSRPLNNYALVWRITRTVRRRPGSTVGAIILGAVMLAALFPAALAPHNPHAGRLADRLRDPSIDHPLGTDEQGRDVLSRIVYGSQVTVLVGGGSVVIAIFLATVVGAMCGYLGGRFELVLQRFIDMAIAFPPLVFVLSVAALFPSIGAEYQLGFVVVGPSLLRALQITVTLGVLMSFAPSRVIRSATLVLKASTFIEGARAIGAGEMQILWRHVLPNLAPLLFVLSSVQLGAAILIESSLSFLGWGIPPPTPSWGQMLSGPARTFIVEHPMLSVWPGLALGLTVYAANMVGDALRDALDPRLRGQ